MNIVAYGGGTNSTAMIIECIRLGIEIDLILFADTGGERPHTYAYIDGFDAWLKKQGHEGIIIVKRVTFEGVIESLEELCLKKKMLPSLAYGYKTCSDKFKARPQNKFMNNWPPAKAEWKAGKQIVKMIGFDADESHRAKKDYSDKKYKYWYPLIEWDWGRDECVDAIRKAGLCSPGKSSCFFP